MDHLIEVTWKGVGWSERRCRDVCMTTFLHLVTHLEAKKALTSKADLSDHVTNWVVDRLTKLGKERFLIDLFGDSALNIISEISDEAALLQDVKRGVCLSFFIFPMISSFLLHFSFSPLHHSKETAVLVPLLIFCRCPQVVHGI